MTVIDALQWRYSVKKFSERKVSSEQLQQLLDATRLSASAFGLQPYKIIVVNTDSIREQLVDYSCDQDKVLYSSHLIVMAIETVIDDYLIDQYIAKHSATTGQSLLELKGLEEHIKSVFRDKSARQKQEWAHHQSFIALGNLLTAAAIMQIDSCPMTGFDASGFDRVLKLHQKGLTSSWVCPIGYRHREDQRANSPKVRFSHQEMVLEI